MGRQVTQTDTHIFSDKASPPVASSLQAPCNHTKPQTFPGPRNVAGLMARVAARCPDRQPNPNPTQPQAQQPNPSHGWPFTLQTSVNELGLQPITLEPELGVAVKSQRSHRTWKGHCFQAHPHREWPFPYSLCNRCEKTLIRFITTAPLHTATHVHGHRWRQDESFVPSFFLEEKADQNTANNRDYRQCSCACINLYFIDL